MITDEQSKSIENITAWVAVTLEQNNGE